MQEFQRKITAVRAEPSAEETSDALLAGATLIPLADSGDFTEAGGHVRILGEVYEYDAMDEGDEDRNIPRRTYLGVSAQNLEDICDQVADFFVEDFRV